MRQFRNPLKSRLYQELNSTFVSLESFADLLQDKCVRVTRFKSVEALMLRLLLRTASKWNKLTSLTYLFSSVLQRHLSSSVFTHKPLNWCFSEQSVCSFTHYVVMVRQVHGFFQSDLHTVRYSAVFFKFQYLIFSLMSSSICLRLLPRLPFPSVLLQSFFQ